MVTTVIVQKMMTRELTTSIVHLIDLFQEVNPAYKLLFKRPVERDAIERLVTQFGEDKVEEVIKTLKVSNSLPYAPVITTPYQLEKKLGQLVAYHQRQKKMNPLVTRL